MAPPPPPPVDQTAESQAPEGQRSLPTPFLSKTYQIVDDPSVDDIISWNDDGSTFIVWRPAEFARDLLPKYFKHNNFSSFVRQLNTYGFRKIVPDRWEFANDCFRRGEKRLLCDIHRRKITSATPAASFPAAAVAIPLNRLASPTNSGEEQVLSSNSSPDGPPLISKHAETGSAVASDLVEENKQLRRENLRLSEELGQMRSMCNNILLLMSKYTADKQQGGEPTVEPELDKQQGGEPTVEPELELIPAGRVPEEAELTVAGRAPEPEEAGLMVKTERSPPPSPSPRLFGVLIGAKRVREENEHNHLAAVTSEVKSEPLDPGCDAPSVAQNWVVYRPRPNRVCNE